MSVTYIGGVFDDELMKSHPIVLVMCIELPKRGLDHRYRKGIDLMRQHVGQKNISCVVTDREHIFAVISFLEIKKYSSFFISGTTMYANNTF